MGFTQRYPPYISDDEAVKCWRRCKNDSPADVYIGGESGD